MIALLLGGLALAAPAEDPDAAPLTFVRTIRPPPPVDLGGHVDLNHAQGYGLTRVGVGLDLTLRLGAAERFGVQGFGWVSAMVNHPMRRWRDTLPTPIDRVVEEVQVYPSSNLYRPPQRAGGLTGVWTPLRGEVGGLALDVDVLAGAAVVHAPVHPRMCVSNCQGRFPGRAYRAYGAAVLGTGVRVAMGRRGSLRLRGRALVWPGVRPDHEAVTTTRRLRVLAMPEVGWTVRLGPQDR